MFYQIAFKCKKDQTTCTAMIQEAIADTAAAHVHKSLKKSILRSDCNGFCSIFALTVTYPERYVLDKERDTKTLVCLCHTKTSKNLP